MRGDPSPTLRSAQDEAQKGERLKMAFEPRSDQGQGFFGAGPIRARWIVPAGKIFYNRYRHEPARETASSKGLALLVKNGSIVQILNVKFVGPLSVGFR